LFEGGLSSWIIILKILQTGYRLKERANLGGGMKMEIKMIGVVGAGRWKRIAEVASLPDSMF